MSKLSPEQKEANKEASLLRQAAYRTRCKELEDEISNIDVSDLEKEADDASVRFENAIQARNNQADDIRSQISALEERLKQVAAEHELNIAPLNEKRKKAYNKLNSERERKSQAIMERYPDLNGNAICYSSKWNPPAGYIEKYAAEHAEEIAKKKAKRIKSPGGKK